MTEPAEGEVLEGRVRLEKQLGHGGYSSVWRATDLVTNEQVAVKILHVEQGDPKTVARFEQEAEILARLEHESIARAFTLGKAGPRRFFTLEYVPGQTLQSRIFSRSESDRHIPLSGVAWLVNGIANALAYAHAHGVVHRDLKPSNIMVNAPRDRPYVKVLDFGAAKALEGAKFDPTTVGRVIGSIAYMAPEQLRSKPVDGRIDQFALAVMLFEMLTLHRVWAWDEDGGLLPFHRIMGDTNSQMDIMVRIVRGERPSVRSLRPDVPVELDRVLRRALAPSPADRFPTMSEFREAVQIAMLDSNNAEPPGMGTAPMWASGGAEIASGAFDDAAPTKAPRIEETVTGDLRFASRKGSTTTELPLQKEDSNVSMDAIDTLSTRRPKKHAIQAAETAAAGPGVHPDSDLEETITDIGEEIDATLKDPSTHDEKRGN